jgi:hypothetical protein
LQSDPLLLPVHTLLFGSKLPKAAHIEGEGEKGVKLHLLEREVSISYLDSLWRVCKYGLMDIYFIF